MRMLTVFIKSLIEQLRDKLNLSLAIFTPTFFVLIFGLFFGKGFYTFSLAVSNADQGVLGTAFVEELKEAKYDNGNKIFQLVTVDYNQEKLTNELKKHNYAAHVYIPDNFSETVNGNGKGTKVTVSGDPGYANFSFADVYTNLFLREFINKVNDEGNSVEYYKNLVAKNNVASEFDNMAPGLIIISVYFLMIITAMILARESEHGTIQRLLFTRLKAWELYLGISLSQVVVGMVMAIAAYFTAIAVGFSPNGSIWLALLISLVSNISAIAIGMVIAAFSKTSVQAFILGNAVITPLFFICGVVMPPPSIKFTELFGRNLELASFLPTYHSVEAMKKVMLNGAGLSDITYELVFLAVLTLVICFIGIKLFNLKYISKYQASNKVSKKQFKDGFSNNA